MLTAINIVANVAIQLLLLPYCFVLIKKAVTALLLAWLSKQAVINFKGSHIKTTKITTGQQYPGTLTSNQAIA